MSRDLLKPRIVNRQQHRPADVMDDIAWKWEFVYISGTA
jgi:hypothetical protein